MFRRSATIALIAITVGLAIPAVANAGGPVEGISDTCSNPSVIHEGFLASRTVFFRVRTQPDPTDSRNTWVCYRVKVGTVDEAGRVDVNQSEVVNSVPWLDGNSRDCVEDPGNTVPGPHPLEEGAVGPVGFFVDTFSVSGTAWVCLEAGSLKERVVVPIRALDTPIVDTFSDPSPAAAQPTMNPQPGLPSSSCYAGAHGTPTELVNTDHGAEHLFVYSALSGLTQAHLCARLHGGPHPAGVDLGVNANPGGIVRVDTSSDVTPCTTNVAALSTPPISIKLSPSGVPPSICVTAPGLPPTRYTIVTLSGPAPATVTLDP
jgi:hypothetical protein